MSKITLTSNALNNYKSEGDAGILSLDKMASALGYTDRFGGLLENFLRDNSGAVEAIFDWVRENYEDKIEDNDDEDAEEVLAGDDEDEEE